MVKVNLYYLGYIHNKNEISKIVTILNSKQNLYHFSDFIEIPSIAVPDIELYAYSREYLFNLLTKHKTKDDAQFHIGIVSSPIEGDFFAFNSEDKVFTVITLYDIEKVCYLSRRTINEYLIFTIIEELTECKICFLNPDIPYDDIRHFSLEGCVFDFCKNKEDKKYKLHKCLLCEHHKSLFKKLNMLPEKEALINILNYIKNPSIIKSTKSHFKNPITAMFYGTFIGGLFVNVLSAFLLNGFRTDKDYIISIVLVLLLLAFPFILFIIDKIKQIKSAIKN